MSLKHIWRLRTAAIARRLEEIDRIFDRHDTGTPQSARPIPTFIDRRDEKELRALAEK
jgi:hypothetical protein